MKYFYKLNFTGATPNYYPNSFNGPVEIREMDSKKGEHVRDSQWVIEQSIVDRHDDGDVQNYEQPRIFWEKVVHKILYLRKCKINFTFSDPTLQSQHL